MRSKLKIAFTDIDNHVASFFASQLARRYELEINYNNADFLIFADRNFGQNNLNYSRKDVTKIFYTGENQRPEDYDCDYALTFDHNFNSWHYRLPLFVIYMWALEHIHKTPYHFNYIFDPVVKPKADFCSFVVSNPNSAPRNKFYELLSQYKKVDSGGRHLNNIGGCLQGEAAKIEFLSSRKFNICFESMSHPGYVTEKILHAFYAGTIPIYWGSPTVSIDFNEQAMIDVNRFKSFDEAIEVIKTVDTNDDLYNFVVNQPKFKFNIPPSYLALDNMMNWFDAVINRRIGKRDGHSSIHI